MFFAPTQIIPVTRSILFVNLLSISDSCAKHRTFALSAHALFREEIIKENKTMLGSEDGDLFMCCELFIRNLKVA